MLLLSSKKQEANWCLVNSSWKKIIAIKEVLNSLQPINIYEAIKVYRY